MGWWIPSIWQEFSNLFLIIACLQAVLLLLTPAFAIYLSERYKPIGILGPVVLCYLCGIFLQNTAFFPLLDRLPLHMGLSDTLASLSVPLGVALLLFSTDLVKWVRLARTTVLSFGCMVVAVLVSASTTFFWGRGWVPQPHMVSGMLVGVYTGGTPNMSAIGLALGVRQELFVLVNASDVILGGTYLMFLLTFAQRFYLLFLPPFKKQGTEPDEEVELESTFSSLHGLRLSVQIRAVGLSILLSVLILAVSVGVSLLLTGKMSVVAIILSVTTLGILASLSARIRSIPGSYETGDYILLVFCVAIGTMTDLQMVMDAGPGLLMYTGCVMFGALVLHLLMAKILGIDADTVVITSTAGIYGPVFIGPVASAMKNREIVVSGLTTGLVGYAVGTYLGLFLSSFLGSF